MTDQTKTPDPLDTRDAPEASGDTAGKAKREPKAVVIGRTKISAEGEKPVYKPTVYLTESNHPDRLMGYLVIADQKHYVTGHINEKANGAEHTDPATGEVSKEKYLTFTEETAAKGEPSQRKTIAHGNAVNHRNDGKPVSFDTLLINVVGGDGKPLRGMVTPRCSPELHKRLGFTHERVALPPRDKAERTAQSPEQSPAQTPAQAEPQAPAKSSRSRPAAQPKAKEDPLAPDAGQPAPSRQRKARAPERVADAGPTR